MTSLDELERLAQEAKAPWVMPYGTSPHAKLSAALDPATVLDLIAKARLGEAWARAEAALPEGWVIDALLRIYAAGTDANGSDTDAWSARAYYHGPRGGPVHVAVKETPEAALDALAAKLEQLDADIFAAVVEVTQMEDRVKP